LREDEHMQAGLWRVPDDLEAVPFELPLDEALLVLDGEIEIAIEGGPTLRLVAGNIASFRKGLRSTVRPERGFKAFWVYS
ncbi:MAG: cupin domain-containing protein, partial [Gaiellaceae bacterium]